MHNTLRLQIIGFYLTACNKSVIPHNTVSRVIRSKLLITFPSAGLKVQESHEAVTVVFRVGSVGSCLAKEKIKYLHLLFKDHIHPHRIIAKDQTNLCHYKFNSQVTYITPTVDNTPLVQTIDLK